MDGVPGAVLVDVPRGGLSGPRRVAIENDLSPSMMFSFVHARALPRLEHNRREADGRVVGATHGATDRPVRAKGSVVVDGLPMLLVHRLC